jgi:hypothetical protein
MPASPLFILLASGCLSLREDDDRSKNMRIEQNDADPPKHWFDAKHIASQCGTSVFRLNRTPSGFFGRKGPENFLHRLAILQAALPACIETQAMSIMYHNGVSERSPGMILGLD